MTIDANAVTELKRVDMKPHRYAGKGEAEFADLCDEHGVAYTYEPYMYELLVSREQDEQGRFYVKVLQAFTPDFLIHATDECPELHVELTVAKHLAPKISNIRRTRALHGVHTTLLVVGTTRWYRITANPDQFQRFLNQAGRRAKKLAEQVALESAA